MLREDVTFRVPMPGTYFATVGTKPRSGDSPTVYTVLLPINLVRELLRVTPAISQRRNVFGGTKTVQAIGFVEYRTH